MNFKLVIRKTHRYLALVVAIQLLAWSIGGFYFSISPIDEIHGDHLVNRAGDHLPESCDGSKGLEIAISTFKQPIKSISSVATSAGSFWKINTQDQIFWFSFCTGEIASSISAEHVRNIAHSYAPNAGEIVNVQKLTGVDVDSEYRGKQLPAWRVDFGGEEKLHLYLDTFSGKVTAARTDRWRIFDFLWMLHVMDYESRDNFNHLLLQVFAAIAVLSGFSGIVLWIISHRKRRWLV